MNKFTWLSILLLTICAIAVANWTWIEDDVEEKIVQQAASAAAGDRPAAVATKYDRDSDEVEGYQGPAEAAAAAQSYLGSIALAADAQGKCYGCVTYSPSICTNTGGNKICYKKCASYGPVPCPPTGTTTLGYNNRQDEDEAEYTYALDYKPEDYITDLTVVSGDEEVACPNGYKKIWVDLNKKAGGKFVYLCIGKNLSAQPVVDITVIKSGDRLHEDSCPSGYNFINVDLNQGAGGKFMYFCFKKSDNGNPLVAVTFAIGKNAGCPSGYKRNSNDLNEGAGGDFVYLCQLYDNNAINEIVLSNVKYDISKLTESDKAVKSVDIIEVDNPTKSKAEGPTLSGSFSVETTKSWSSSSSIAVGVTLTIKTGVPLTGWEQSIEFSNTYTYTTETGGSITDTVQKTYSIPCTAAPKTITRCDAQYRQADIDVPFTSDAIFKYKNGKTVTKKFSGVYKGVSVSSVRMKKTVVHYYK